MRLTESEITKALYKETYGYKRDKLFQEIAETIDALYDEIYAENKLLYMVLYLMQLVPRKMI